MLRGSTWCLTSQWSPYHTQKRAGSTPLDTTATAHEILCSFTALWVLCIPDYPSMITYPKSITIVQGVRGTSCQPVSMPAPAPRHQALRHLNVLGRVELAIPTGVSVRKGACLSIISNLNT